VIIFPEFNKSNRPSPPNTLTISNFTGLGTVNKFDPRCLKKQQQLATQSGFI
jgi:hypothetical protein